MDSDAWDIIAIAASRDRPALFIGDGLLGNPEHISIYRNAYVTLLRIIAKFTVDYDRAIELLQGPFLFLHLSGFYLLGRSIYKSRYWAFLLAVVSTSYVDVFGGEYYGAIWEVALPRDLFLALLPYLYYAAWTWRKTPRFWPALMLIAGLYVYVHPASGPQIGFGIWLALFAMGPSSAQWKRRAGQMLLLGVLFLAGALPYLIGMDHGVSSASDSTLFHNILALSYRPLYLSPVLFLQDLWAHLLQGGYLLLIVGVVGLVVQLAWFRKTAREVVYVGLWFVGIVIIVFVSEIQIALSSKFDFVPIEVNFLRAVRYIPVWCFISGFWPLATKYTDIRENGNQATKVTLAVAGLLLASSCLWMFPPRHAKEWLACWSRGKVCCSTNGGQSQEIFALAKKVAESVPPGKSLLCTSSALTRIVRAYSLRPVVFGSSDGAFIFFSDSQKAQSWYQSYVDLKSIRSMDYKHALAALTGKARAHGAQYLLSDLPTSRSRVLPPELGLKKLWAREGVELFQVGL